MARRRARAASREGGKRRPTPSADERRIVVLFADIMGCSEISNHKSMAHYNSFLREFHAMFDRVAEDHKALYAEHERVYFQAQTRGDEGCLMIFVPDGDLAADVDTAINMALDLKRRWLLSEDNTTRIEQGLLPSDLAIGIHLGMACINKERDSAGKTTYRPEGYAINLAKRTEGASRDGSFTHIYVSEAARNALYLLTDESTYTFSTPNTIQPRGISRDIRVFEVKHHFLPTDWREIPLGQSRPRSRALLYEPTEVQIGTARQAYDANPTNLWLAEEYIYLMMRYQGLEIDRRKGGDEADAYQDALDVSRRLATGDQRDAGILTITGFILGERGDFSEEQRLYQEALDSDKQYPEAHWYLGYSLSAELCRKLDDEGRSDAAFKDLKEDEPQAVGEILDCYRRAIELNARQPWMQYDLACEHWRWGHKQEAVNVLDRAVSLNDAVLDYVEDERYLEGIDQESRIKKLLKGR